MQGPVSSKLLRLRRAREGSVAVLIAVALVPLIGAIGIATDTARGYYLKSRLSSAVDAAALAGGQVYFQSRRDDDVRQFFKSNFPPGFMGASAVVPQITASSDNKTLTVSASATIPTTFMRLFGQTSMTVAASAEVTRESKALDVVLAIDMSGSMLWDVNGNTIKTDKYGKPLGVSRLQLAREAAKKLVNVLYGDETDVQYLRMGLVPWAALVNVTTDQSHYGYSWTDSDGDGTAQNSEFTLLSEGGSTPPCTSGDNVRVCTEDTASYHNNHIGMDPDNLPATKQQASLDGRSIEYKSPNGGKDMTTIWYAHNSEVPLLSEPDFKPTDDTSPASSVGDNPSQVWDGCVWARWEASGPTADTEDGVDSDWPGWSPRGIGTHVAGSGAMAQDVWKWVNDQYVFNSDPDPENGFSGFGGFSYASDGGLGGSQNLLQHLDDYSDGVYRPLAEPAIDRDNAYLPSVKGSSASNPKDSYVEVKCYYNCGTLVPAHWEVQTKTFSNCPDGNGGSSECTPCPVNGITPLTEGKAAINAAIDRLTIPPVPSGTNYYTNIPQGLVWGWRVVSPDAPFTEGADHPADYEPSRAIILLTDGEDNHAVGDAYNNALSNSDLDDKLKAIANNIKAVKDDHGNPVYDIYVIQFTSDGSASTDLLKSIASAKTAPYYFNAPTGDELSDAFEQIGNHLSNLRLSK